MPERTFRYEFSVRFTYVVKCMLFYEGKRSNNESSNAGAVMWQKAHSKGDSSLGSGRCDDQPSDTRVYFIEVQYDTHIPLHASAECETF